MANYTLPHFGQLDLSNLEEYYDSNIHLNGQEISADLNFESNSIDPAKMDAVKSIIENIAEFDKRNKQYINDDYNDEEGDTVQMYIEHHLDLAEGDNPEDQLLKSLHLVRVGFYPENDEQFITFDYSIDQERTQYLVVIFTDKDGILDYLTMES